MRNKTEETKHGLKKGYSPRHHTSLSTFSIQKKNKNWEVWAILNHSFCCAFFRSYWVT